MAKLAVPTLIRTDDLYSVRRDPREREAALLELLGKAESEGDDEDVYWVLFEIVAHRSVHKWLTADDTALQKLRQMNPPHPYLGIVLVARAWQGSGDRDLARDLIARTEEVIGREENIAQRFSHTVQLTQLKVLTGVESGAEARRLWLELSDLSNAQASFQWEFYERLPEIIPPGVPSYLIGLFFTSSG